MINPIDHVMTRITYTIPMELMTLAFAKYLKIQNRGVSVPQLIETHVIRGRVLKDCNLMGGNYKDIILRYDYMEKVLPVYAGYGLDINYSLYRIPAEERENLPISEVIHLTYPGPAVAGMPPAQMNFGATVGTLAAAALDSQTFGTSIVRPIPELLSGDLVRLVPAQYNGNEWVLKCRLAYDDQFTSLNSSAIEVLAELCLAAMKHYIYVNLSIAIDRSVVEMGFDIGRIREFVDEYKEAEQRYKELLKDFSGTATLSVSGVRNLLQYIL
jgi:hypothetical protein